MKKIPVLVVFKRKKLAAIFKSSDRKQAWTWRTVPGAKIYKSTIHVEEEI